MCLRILGRCFIKPIGIYIEVLCILKKKSKICLKILLLVKNFSKDFIIYIELNEIYCFISVNLNIVGAGDGQNHQNGLKKKITYTNTRTVKKNVTMRNEENEDVHPEQHEHLVPDHEDPDHPRHNVENDTNTHIKINLYIHRYCVNFCTCIRPKMCKIVCKFRILICFIFI